MFWAIFAFISGIKILLIPSYRSTDFEVHRNWLAITHSLPISKWYFEDTSEWTLDYPPFFAYFEYVLSHFAKFFDPEMLKIENLNYSSEKTILFQRFSVILTDFIFALGVKVCINSLHLKTSLEKTVTAGLLLCNVGLIFVDHIHFQYNGFLFGVLLLSIGKLLQHKYLQSGFLFCMLLNLKHIFLYIAPVYGVFMFKFYCWKSNNFFSNLIKLGTIVISCVLISFGPFYDQIPQVLSRLFPFKRGLTHAYWAPNFWALYNFVDKISAILLKGINSKSANTGGLVQEYEHQFLPSVNPMTTFILTGLFMLPCLIKIGLTQDNKMNNNFLKAIVICSCTSFMFGWHVHEKAILMVIIPISLLATTNLFEAKSTIFLLIVGHYSLFPLLFTPELVLIKSSLYLAYTLACYLGLKTIHKTLNIKLYEKFYLFGFVCLLIYEQCLQYILNFDKKLPFLPLMLTSVYCSLGVLYFYCKYYFVFLSTSSVVNKKKVK